MKKAWRIWAKTIGPKISEKKEEADAAAVLRTFWIVLGVLAIIFNSITNCFIIAGVIRHWFQ